MLMGGTGDGRIQFIRQFKMSFKLLSLIKRTRYYRHHVESANYRIFHQHCSTKIIRRVQLCNAALKSLLSVTVLLGARVIIIFVWKQWQLPDCFVLFDRMRTIITRVKIGYRKNYMSGFAKN